MWNDSSSVQHCLRKQRPNQAVFSPEEGSDFGCLNRSHRDIMMHYSVVSPRCKLMNPPGLNWASSAHLLFVQCCFTSTQTVWTVRVVEPRTAISIFTQLPSFETPLPKGSVMLDVHRDLTLCRAQDVHLFFHTARSWGLKHHGQKVQWCLTSTET